MDIGCSQFIAQGWIYISASVMADALVIILLYNVFLS